jgi:hypothetical protein
MLMFTNLSLHLLLWRRRFKTFFFDKWKTKKKKHVQFKHSSSIYLCILLSNLAHLPTFFSISSLSLSSLDRSKFFILFCFIVAAETQNVSEWVKERKAFNWKAFHVHTINRDLWVYACYCCAADKIESCWSGRLVSEMNLKLLS